jgi:hypothetical protein
MGHRVVDAIIEDGQLKYVGEKLPTGRLKVHLIYDTIEADKADRAVEAVLADTWGIYKDIDPGMEAKNLRAEWERGTR